MAIYDPRYGQHMLLDQNDTVREGLYNIANIALCYIWPYIPRLILIRIQDIFWPRSQQCSGETAWRQLWEWTSRPSVLPNGPLDPQSNIPPLDPNSSKTLKMRTCFLDNNNKKVCLILDWTDYVFHKMSSFRCCFDKTVVNIWQSGNMINIILVKYKNVYLG